MNMPTSPDENFQNRDEDVDDGHGGLVLPWFLDDDHWKRSIGAFCSLLFVVLMIFALFRQPVKGNKITLPQMRSELVTPKGEMSVQNNFHVDGQLLRTAITIFSHIPSSPFDSIHGGSHHMTSSINSELGDAINGLHQRLIIRRLTSKGMNFNSSLDDLDFVQKKSEKCVCAAALTGSSLLSIKYITFASRSSLTDKVGHIRKNVSYDMYELPAEKNIVHATRSATVHSRQKCSTAYQATEIVTLRFPKSTNYVAAEHLSLETINCYIKYFSGNGDKDFNCLLPSFSLKRTTPNSETCRHLTQAFNEYEARKIPQTIISTFFCH